LTAPAGPDHEMKQAIRTQAISSKNPDFDGSEQKVYAQEDRFAYAGASVGYCRYTLKSGERIWAKFDSVHFTTSTQGSWGSTYQGVFRFTAGTAYVFRDQRRRSLQGRRYARRVRRELRVHGVVLRVTGNGSGAETKGSANVDLAAAR
jgi:hypothetical protein